MIALGTFFAVLIISLLVVRVATVALSHTGLSRDVARFEARSAFTGTGFTTSASESVVNHPVRRRIIMMLMLIRSAGMITVASTLILSFLQTGQSSPRLRFALLVVGLAVIWVFASSRWVDQRLSRWIERALKRWTNLTICDYSKLLHLADNYAVSELSVQESDWLAGRRLAELSLSEEGVLVLGLTRTGGEFIGAPRGHTTIQAGDELIVYGRTEAMEKLDQRTAGFRGNREHVEAIVEQKRFERKQQDDDGPPEIAPENGRTQGALAASILSSEAEISTGMER